MGAQIKNCILEEVYSLPFHSWCWVDALVLLLMLFLLLPSMAVEPVFPSFHWVTEISSFLGIYWGPSARLGLLRHPTLWTEWQQLITPFPQWECYSGINPTTVAHSLKINSGSSASQVWFGCCYYFKACLIDSPWGNANQTLGPPWLITCEAVSHTWHRDFHLIPMSSERRVVAHTQH